MFTKPGVAQAHSAKIDAAEEAWLEGDLDECADLIEAFRNQLKAPTGKSISPTDAKLLDAGIANETAAAGDNLYPPDTL